MDLEFAEFAKEKESPLTHGVERGASVLVWKLSLWSIIVPRYLYVSTLCMGGWLTVSMGQVEGAFLKSILSYLVLVMLRSRHQPTPV